jgi:hypothetical protein
MTYKMGIPAEYMNVIQIFEIIFEYLEPKFISGGILIFS